MDYLDRLISLVKTQNHICVSIDVADALIKTLRKPCYDDYYYIRSISYDFGYVGSYYIKLKDKYKLFVFRIVIHLPTNYACISYDYGINDLVDRILLKWLIDLLTDCKYLKEDLKNYEK